ncbi:hypothetical protein DYH10_01690 [Candidatus Saccharibacteria bacterium CPR2]|nr:hypothetical protein [Candidatus Saccharibacteria bacterium CPR2]
MAESIQQPETVDSPEKIIGAMSTAMQVAFSECGIEPVQLDDSSSEKSVETTFRNSIDPIAVKLIEKTDAEGNKSYEFYEISYHQEGAVRGVRWTEGSSELERIWRPIGSESQPSSTVARKVDSVSFEELRDFYSKVKKVPEEYKAEQAYNEFHGVTQSGSRF